MRTSHIILPFLLASCSDASPAGKLASILGGWRRHIESPRVSHHIVARAQDKTEITCLGMKTKQDPSLWLESVSEIEPILKPY